MFFDDKLSLLVEVPKPNVSIAITPIRSANFRISISLF